MELFYPLVTLCHPMIFLLPEPLNSVLSRFYSESNELFGIHGNNSKGFLCEL